MAFTSTYPADADLSSLVHPIGSWLMKLLKLLHWLHFLLDVLRGSDTPRPEGPEDKHPEDLSYVQSEFFQSQAGLW